MKQFKIIPILGLKNDVPQNDARLFKFLSENVAYTYDVGGINVDYERKRGTCAKGYGYSAWSNTAVGTPTRCLGMFELDDGTNRDNIIFYDGEVYYYDGTPDPVQLNNAYLDYDGQTGEFAIGLTITGGNSGTTAVITDDVRSGDTGTLYLQTVAGTGFENNEPITDTDTGAAVVNGVLQTTTFASDEGDIYSVIKHGSYMIFTDRCEHTPYKWKNGDQRLSKLIGKVGATEYKFRYLVEWQRRIIGAYSNQTNGDLEIRWTDALPTWTDLEFASANQLYKPTTDSISGISLMGANALYLYGTDSISRVVYYPDVTAPFGIEPMVDGEGCAGHNSIVNVKGANYFFNKNYGFVRYIGGSKVVSDDIISRDVDTDIAGIDSRYYERIVGKYIPRTEEICWAVPLAAATTPSHLLYYSTRTGMWRKEDKAARYIDVWTRTAGQYKKPVFSNADGHTYQITGDTIPSTGNLDGYRIEPILDFGEPTKFKTVQEIWWGIVSGGDYSIDISYRVGDTVKEVEAASFTSWGSLNINAPSEPKVNPNIRGRYIQIKWRTNLDSEYFAINWIDFRYTIEDDY